MRGHFRTVGLAIFAALCASALTLRAQTRIAPGPQHFEIHAGGLHDALNQYALQSHLQILFAPDLILNSRTAGVVGNFTAGAALERLLRDSGLTYRLTSDRTVLVEAAEQPVPNAVPAAAARVGAAIHLAVEDSEPPKPVAEEEEIDEVVITARRREERLFDVPEAISSVTGKQLEELNAVGFKDYARTIPSLNYVTKADGTRDFSIRGINATYESAPATSATVSQYLDETPVTSTDAQFDFRLADIERIEVLRGPQGTLYGEGAMGGAIRIITRKPDTHQLSGSFEARASDTQNGGISSSAQAMVNLPLLTDKLAARATAYVADNAGYVDNVASKVKDTNSTWSEGGRVVLLWTPDPLTHISLQGLLQKDHGNYDGPYQPDIGDLQYTSVSDASFSDRLGHVFNLTAQRDFGNARLVAASSYTDGEDFMVLYQEPADLGPDFMAGSNRAQSTRRHAFAQELRLGSIAAESRFVWLGGLFYLDRQRALHSTFNNNICAFIACAPGEQRLGVAAEGSNRFLEKQQAAFGEIGWKFTEALAVTGGLRYTDVSVESFSRNASLFEPNPPESRLDGADHALSGKLNVSYRFAAGRLLYAQVSRGFRAGGINELSTVFPTLPRSFKPDFTWNYELGAKWMSDDQRLHASSALFHIDWIDIQTNVSYATPGGERLSAVGNAGSAAVDGLEFEMGWAPNHAFNVNFSGSYIDARLTADQPSGGGFDAGLGLSYPGRKGDPIPGVNKWQASVSTSLRRPAFNGFEWLFTANYQFVSPTNSQFNAGADHSNPNFFRLDAQHNLMGQVGLSRGDMSVMLYVENPFDRRQALARFGRRGMPGDPPSTFVFSNVPRTVGITLRTWF